MAVSFISPLELIRTKLQTEVLSYSEIIKGMRRDIQTSGLRVLTLGLGPSLLRDVPFSGKYLQLMIIVMLIIMIK